MGDIIDDANDAADTFRDAEIRNARAGTAKEAHPGFDGKHCVEEACGVKIPAARLKLGKVRCVECQERRENLARRKL